MNFDSHTDGIVGLAAALVNIATPGTRQGRPYDPPRGSELVEEITATLGGGDRGRPPPDDAQARALACIGRRLRGVFEQIQRRDIDTAAQTVNALLEELQPVPYLERHDGESWHLHYPSRDQDLVATWAAGFAMALAMVLGSDCADQLGVCSAPRCDRVFVDNSRNRRRRFCSTACQNRVKAAAHRSRLANRTPTSLSP
ncbi:MAG TPA: CGNR zinc finger domain-containing protein [Sporichthyaceae bacterium]|jgi:predicted RNA-binding Zn ribbon-like protein|nr:CGNR zinc finger domain-containing protein [Sporichthyaceae bacterium]